MASGFLAAAAIVGLVGLRVMNQRSVSRGEILTALSGLTVVAFGLAVKVTVAQHAQLQARSASDFIGTLLENLAWPFGAHPVMLLLLQLPLALVTVKFFRGGFRNPRAAEFVLALGGWAFLQALVLAYGRARMAESSRYLDALSTLPLANCAALFVLAAENNFSPRLKKWALPFALIWSSILIFGQVQSSRATAENYLEGARGWGLAQVQTVRAFIATGDAEALKNSPREAVPYWSADWLVEILQQPKLVSILPAEAFPPTSELKKSGRFSAAALTMVDHAVAILCVGLVMCAFLAGSALRRPEISLCDEGGAWLCVLLVALTAGLGAFCERNVDRRSYTVSLHKKLALVYANSARPAEAALHLHEALALQPNDAEAQKELQMLESGRLKSNPSETKP